MHTLTSSPTARAPKHRLAIRLGRVSAEHRGALLWFVDGRIEEALGIMGALPRPAYVKPGEEELLADQLYRARLVGVEYIELHFESLREVELHGVLVERDAETWARWLSLSRKKPLSIRLDEALGPEARADFDGEEDESGSMPSAAEPETDAPRGKPKFFDQGSFFDDEDDVELSLEPNPELDAPRALGLSQSAPLGNLRGGAGRDAPTHDHALRAAVDETDGVPEGDVLDEACDRAATAPTNSAAPEAHAPAQAAADGSPDVNQAPALPPGATSAADGSPDVNQAPALPPGAAHAAGESSGADVSASPNPAEAAKQPSTAPPKQRPQSSPVSARAEAPNDALAPRDFDARASEAALSSTSGALSFDLLERLFWEHYLPLRHRALSGNLASDGVDPGVLERFDAEFATGYQAVYPRLGGRSRRPRMVLDVPQLAHALQRRVGASHCRLLLVDALRVDVGVRVLAKLRLQLLDTASLVESGLLWAGLPATTATQLELLAKGADGLRTFEGSLDDSQLTSHQEARRPRALRAGPHALHKLDAVQTGLPDRISRSALDALAADVAVSAARFIKQLPPDCVVWLFGDHGFATDPADQSPGPERVLVPYQVWQTEAAPAG